MHLRCSRRTPLWFAAQRGQRDSVLQELQRLHDCAQLTLKDHVQQTPATDAQATHGSRVRAALENDAESVLDELFSALQVATTNDHHATVAAIVEWTLSGAARTDIRTKFESLLHAVDHAGAIVKVTHPLVLAAHCDAVQTCAMFLDVRPPSRTVRLSALWCAVRWKHFTVANVLVDSFSDQMLDEIERDNLLQSTLLPIRSDLAPMIGRIVNNKRRLGMLTLQVVRRLLGRLPEARAAPSHKVLREAANFGSVPICELVLSAKASVASVDCDGWTALHHAVRKGRCGVAQVLLRHASRHCPDASFINVRTRNYNYTPLHYAASVYWESNAACGEDRRVQQQRRMLQLLLHHRADVNARSAQGLTPMEILVTHEAPISVIECMRAFSTC